MGRPSTWSAVWWQTYDRLRADGLDSVAAEDRASAAARAAEQARRDHRRAMNAEYQRRHRAKVRLEKRRLLNDVTLNIKLPPDLVEILDSEVKHVYGGLPRDTGRSLLVGSLITHLKEHQPYTDGVDHITP